MVYADTILITGGTSGLGYATATALAQASPHTQIIITGRTLPEGALDKHSSITYLPLDLTTHQAVRDFVVEFKKHGYPPISAFIINAGFQTLDKLYINSDGLESMFAVNYVNQALLFFLLSSHLAQDARIISVGSSVHDPKFERAVVNYTTASDISSKPVGSELVSRKDSMSRYGQSKLCNILFTFALNDYIHSKGKQWTALALDPGVMPTGLFRHTKGIAGRLIMWSFRSSFMKWFIHDLLPTEHTAAVLKAMAIEERYAKEEMKGKYIGAKDGQVTTTSEQSLDKANQKDLWDWTLRQILTSEERVQWAF